MSSEPYGYVRVSSKDQNEERQIIAMRSFGVRDSRIYVDKQSGKDFNRPQYKRLVKKLKQGDVVVIKSIDRLGRNYDEILTQWRFLTKKKGVEIIVLDMPLLNTGRRDDLTGVLIADIVLQLLSYVAQTERDNIRQRQAEGIAAARARGVHLGRPPMELPESFSAMMHLYQKGAVSSREAAKVLGISSTTFLRWVKHYQTEAPELNS